MASLDPGWRVLQAGGTTYEVDHRRRLADPRLLAAHATTPGREGRLPAGVLRRWYGSMAPLWLGVPSVVHRQLVLQVHLWIEARVLEGECWPPPALELHTRGPLYHRLVRLVPVRERPRWQPWIVRLLGALARALAEPPGRRDLRWARDLLTLPCRVPPPLAEPLVLRAL